MADGLRWFHGAEMSAPGATSSLQLSLSRISRLCFVQGGGRWKRVAGRELDTARLTVQFAAGDLPGLYTTTFRMNNGTSVHMYVTVA